MPIITPLMGCCSVPIFTRCSTCICLAFNQKHLRFHSIRSLSVTATVTSGARDCGFLRSFVQVLRHLEFGGGGSTIIFVVRGVFERTNPLSEDRCSVLDGEIDRVERVEGLTFAQADSLTPLQCLDCLVNHGCGLPNLGDQLPVLRESLQELVTDVVHRRLSRTLGEQVRLHGISQDSNSA